MTPDRSDVLYGTLGLMIIKTLEALGPLHGYRIARRIEQISGNQLALNQGTLYPALLKLEQLEWISSRWGTSESGRRVKIYALTRAGRRQLQKEEAQWERAASIIERFLKISEGRSWHACGSFCPACGASAVPAGGSRPRRRDQQPSGRSDRGVRPAGSFPGRGASRRAA
jgi:PadR family transcriptional regulator PadR